MTVLPDIKATPIRTIQSSRLSRTQSLPKLSEPNAIIERKPSSRKNEIRTSIPPQRTKTPKIKIVARHSLLKQRFPKTDGAKQYNFIWKPFVKEPYDYDYQWEPVLREDIRHQYDNYIPPEKIIASRPDDPYAMTTYFETEDRHYQNYTRHQQMKQAQWNRDHIEYTIYPYSKIDEREMYNKRIRSTLKEQMEQKTLSDKSILMEKNHETLMAIEQDRHDLEHDKQKQIARSKILLNVTANNKKLMENKWDYDNWNRKYQWHVDRSILMDDPINWSKTMT
ncbi:unnamed protein product [Didymodactylos carnosus]|uniref:Uncharacterized protein n=1 Tax=Didymodactylos carnosus TaxID=1234261 RepID=A0A813QZW8_9BILA|nr:unnamed protein product [Didymodactylos carnosus]CAF3556929.1 unnamed protein product [Didymodactylos carnosus]